MDRIPGAPPTFYGPRGAQSPHAATKSARAGLQCAPTRPRRGYRRTERGSPYGELTARRISSLAVGQSGRPRGSKMEFLDHRTFPVHCEPLVTLDL